MLKKSTSKASRKVPTKKKNIKKAKKSKNLAKVHSNLPAKFKEIDVVYEYMQAKGVSELSFKNGSTEISLKLNVSILNPDMSLISTSQKVKNELSTIHHLPKPENTKTPEVNKLHEVKSPFVGTFYPASGPDEKPYVEVGQLVSKGQVLGIVEAMKLMNEIESDVNGVVKRVLLQSGTPAEFGEALFEIEAQ